MCAMTANQPDPDAITNTTRLPEPDRIVQMQWAMKFLDGGLKSYADLRNGYPEYTDENGFALASLINAMGVLVYAAGGDRATTIRDLGYPGFDGPRSDESDVAGTR